jgi:hypothetical protein
VTEAGWLACADPVPMMDYLPGRASARKLRQLACACCRAALRVIYEDRKMPEGTLDNARLAILADALLDAGCSDEDLIQHLRSPGPHVRGCWAVDRILGKG